MAFGSDPFHSAIIGTFAFKGEGGAARAIFGVPPLAAPYFAGVPGGWPFCV